MTLALFVAATLMTAPAKPAPPVLPQAKAVAAFLREIRKNDPHKAAVVDAAVMPYDHNTLVIVVGSDWRSASRSERLDVATVFQLMWADFNKGNQPNPQLCQIVLMNEIGRQVGSSSAFSGIKVED